MVPLSTLPENMQTLLGQQGQLIQGNRAAQMFPNGTGELPLPLGAGRVQTPNGVFHFNPQQTNAQQILNSPGQENHILGLGPFSKMDVAKRVIAGEPLAAVVERSPQGHELRAAVGTPSTVPHQVHHMRGWASRDSEVRVESPLHTLMRRIHG